MGKSKHEQPVVTEPAQSKAAPVEPTAAPNPDAPRLGFQHAPGRLGTVLIHPEQAPSPTPYQAPPPVPAPPTDLPSGSFGIKAP